MWPIYRMLKSANFWDLTPCSEVEAQHLGEKYFHSLAGSNSNPGKKTAISRWQSQQKDFSVAWTVGSRACWLHLAGFLPGLLCNPEDESSMFHWTSITSFGSVCCFLGLFLNLENGGSMFIWNGNDLLPNYMVFHQIFLCIRNSKVLIVPCQSKAVALLKQFCIIVTFQLPF
jgi:hypothetical protein